MNAPVNGKDRYWNADEFFAMGEQFFMVEFKSYKHSLKDENRKPSACHLCAKLAENGSAEKLHDMAHFAAWGEKPYGDDLLCNIGIYRLLICHPKALPLCEHVQSVVEVECGELSTDFIQRITASGVGLTEQKFTSYLRWLIEEAGEGGGSGFPLGLYAFSTARGIRGREFKDYDAFSTWARNEPKIRNAKLLSNILKP
ncbi:MAG: hypothetical protein EOO78_03010 [Oxalobacteraceae bacterium]|nr:MAG: hypothetical protein EOO78_03010 [Oxalobacteraceae bacterium]